MEKAKNALRQLGIQPGDLLLAAGLLALSAALGMVFLLHRPEPEMVSVRVDGKEIARLPLHSDCTYAIGEGNTIEIAGGRVRMTEADCPDKICVKTGYISRSGQSIVCAPHKVTVTVTGADRNASYDILTN